ncbi:GGDEF domain-containing protein [Methylomonas methanica]|uniref:diguanylate cyclase n=1 Tax=Methylomonas methanica TaxID=421 RepID=A0A177MBL1_METMH|nr:GGDEF domain-containing protein [Methylomonas methanica]OAI02735.1 diguanylate cyclase [Methylomonas methanica]
MVFFKNKDEGPDRWKEKYLKLLDDQEQTEKQYKANEELLCKTIVRFALAVKGLNRQLDPHLNRIRNLLKGGLQSQQLQKELSAFSNALIMLEESPEPTLPDASLLFEFLGKQYPRHLDQLDEIRGKYENRQFSNNQAFYLALLELVEENKPLTNIDLALELTGADAKAINIQLIRLLDNAEIPLLFAEDAEKIKSRLFADQALGPIFDDTVALLLAVKKHLESEQQEMAAFLSKLTEQLTELGVKATGVNAANEIRVKKRNLLDQAVSEQIMELREKSENATQLEPLKQIVSSRLTTITQQIQAHNLQEQQERDKAQREMQILSQKLREMESESSELRSKLDLAQHRATRDPLTNLPNRLAFEDRLNDEMARCRRHKSPMTLMVWDVDLFKNINDTYGHKCGDKALIVIAELLLKHCRETDFVARFGGEEFVMILPGADAKSALVIAEKLRKTLEKSSFNANGNKVFITLSCGISQFIDGDNNETIFNRADSGLYSAKQTGRNRCVVV